MIVAVKEYWKNSPMSPAKNFGGIRINGTKFVIVNEHGKTLFETSIDANEPADLIDERYIKLYKMYGRQAFLDLLSELEHEPTPTEMKRLLAERYPSESAKKKQAPKNEEPCLPLD
jgi:hypothetical protein